MLAGPGGPVTQGPVRVIPGRLSVSRTFGDCHAKMEKYNGNPNVIIVDPEIHHVKITDDSHKREGYEWTGGRLPMDGK